MKFNNTYLRKAKEFGRHSKGGNQSPSRSKAQKLEKYNEALQNLPPPGSGSCHTSLLGIANLGVFDNLLSADQIFSGLRSQLDSLSGSRRVPDREIREAIKRAFNDAD